MINAAIHWVINCSNEISENLYSAISAMSKGIRSESPPEFLYGGIRHANPSDVSINLQKILENESWYNTGKSHLSENCN